MSNPNSSIGSRLGAAVLFSLLSTSVVAAQDKAAADGAAANDEEMSFLDAFTKGKVNATFYYRFENVDMDSFAKKGRASTLRTTLGYRTAKFKGFQGYLEFEDVTDLGAKYLYNNAGAGSYSNGVANRPVVADPAGTNIQQVYLDYTYGKTLARVGAQEISLDDERFVGPVGWRQHHQTFDALLIASQEIENANIYFAYVNKVKTIKRGVLETDTAIFNANYTLKDLGQITVYDYYIDLTAAPSSLSTNTIGAEFKGQRKLDDDWGYRYEVEFASQTDVSDNPVAGGISALYYHLMLGGIYKGYGFRVAYEVLGSDNGNAAFQTPLATLHAWNGWADMFLTTPANGLQDLYFKLDGPLGKAKWALIYHIFSADNGGADYGTELDGIVTCKASWGQTFGVKFAYYNADTWMTDTTKAWLFTGFKF